MHKARLSLICQLSEWEIVKKTPKTLTFQDSKGRTRVRLGFEGVRIESLYKPCPIKFQGLGERSLRSEWILVASAKYQALRELPDGRFAVGNWAIKC